MLPKGDTEDFIIVVVKILIVPLFGAVFVFCLAAKDAFIEEKAGFKNEIFFSFHSVQSLDVKAEQGIRGHHMEAIVSLD